MSPRDKYGPLRIHLERVSRDTVELTFDALEALLDIDLPASAGTYREWWANTTRNHQAKAWLEPGWRVHAVNLTAERVTFRPFR